MLILGIDPGITGALALLRDGIVVDIFDAPTLQVKVGKSIKNEIDEAALHRIMAVFRRQVTHGFIERVQPMPSVKTNEDGERQTMGATSAFNFGQTYMAFRQCMACNGIPYTRVMPGQWKKAMSVPKEKDGARMRANQLLPSGARLWLRKKDHGRAEAALIALWGFRELGGQS